MRNLESLVVIGLELRHILRFGEPLERYRIEHDRRFFELIENEQERAGEKDDELHRDLDERAEQKRKPAFLERTRRQIALHLTLVGPEIREHEKNTATDAGPKRIGDVGIQIEVHRLRTPGRTHDLDRVRERDPVGKAHDDRAEAEQDPEKDDQHLPHLDPHDRAHAAERCVDCGAETDRDDDDFLVDAENNGEYDGGRIDHNGVRKTSPQKKKKARQAPSLPVEALLQIFVGGKYFGAIEKRHERDAKDHYRERHAEIDLDEAHAVHVALTGRADERDGARLGRHDRKTDRVPRHRTLGEKEVFDPFIAATRPIADKDDERKVKNDNEPVDRMQHQRA